MKKVFISIAIFLILIIIIIIVGTKISRRALPNYSVPFEIQNLSDSVWVYRDSFAMPHVYARNSKDLYRVTGYLTAQDRLWQMDLLRHVTTGQLSELFGKDLLEADILMRSLGMPEKSAKLFAESSPEIKDIFEAYSDGINQYINENIKNLPPEFAILGYKPELWKPEQSFNLVGYMAWDLNGSWIAEIVLHKLKAKLGIEKTLQLVPYFDSTLSVIYPQSIANQKSNNWESDFLAANQKIQELGVSVFHGSNNWAVNSSRSENGKPLLANDMHLGLNAPGIWYQMHQVIEGQLNVTGVMLPGAPFIISGHNDAIAWGMTNVMNDDIDFYQEEINPADSNQYKFNGNWKLLDIRKEKIAIKGGDTILRILKFTHRGPVVSNLKGIYNESISMHWLGNEWSNEIRTVYLLNRAKNWEEFKDAIKSFIAVSQNIVYADTAGNIGLYCAAGVPKRKGPAWEVLPGTNDEFDWKGMVPFDSLPHYYNPSSGIAVSANNKTAPVDYPNYISYWYDLPFRFNRITNMLLETEKHNAQSFKAIQTDFHSENVKYYLPKLLEMLRHNKLSDQDGSAYKILKEWNMSMDADQVAPSLYETFFLNFLKNIYRDDMGDSLYKEFIADKILVRNAIHHIWTNDNSDFVDDINTKDKSEKINDIIINSFRETITQLNEKYGTNINNWKWGEIHQLSVNHFLGKVWLLDKFLHLNRGPYKMGGSFHTVEPYSYKYTNPFETTHGASQRHVYVTGNWDESWTVIPTGISGIPSSPYYCDQTELYINKKYKHDWFSRQAVVKNAKYKILLKP